MRVENDEPIYTFNDKYLRHFIGQNVKGGRICAFDQYYKSKTFRDVLKNLPQNLKIKGFV